MHLKSAYIYSMAGLWSISFDSVKFKQSLWCTRDGPITTSSMNFQIVSTFEANIKNIKNK